MAIQLKTGYAMTLVLLALAGGGAGALAAPAGTLTAGAAARLPATPVAQAGSVHATRALPAALRPVLYQALAKDAGPAYAINKDGCATLPRQKLTACFNGNGAHFTGAGSLALHLAAWGRGDKLASVTAARPEISGNRVSYVHGNLTAWWQVLPVGFEQGFTITKRPSGNGELTLALAMSRQDACLCVSACLRAARRQARRQAGAPAIRHSRAGGNPVEKGIPTGGQDTNAYWIPAFAGMTKKKNGNTLAWGKLKYGQLVVTDAKGKVVPATLKNEGDRVLIAVNDAHAAYPLTVDPLVWLEQKVTASDGAANDEFGWSVAVSGTTALVGAPLATVNGNSGQGAAYVFGESGGSWTQTAKLTASDGEAYNYFGISVALDGTTALIGAPNTAVNSNTEQGAAYVFSESGGSWTQTAKLTASDGAAYDEFGASVALAGTTALVGVNFATINGNPYQGAAYVFSDSGGTWMQTAKLTASDGAAYDEFGASVALAGTTALVGANFATSNGHTEGAAYVFSDSGGTWMQTVKLTASDGAASDQFGTSVALSGTTALVGAPYATVNGNYDQGAAYVFGEAGGSWTQTAKLTASDGAAYDAFGHSVALSGTTALVGAPYATVNGNYAQGAAYVFGEAGGSWTQTVKLSASDGAANDEFGWSVALDGTTALISAPNATVNGNINQGAAYFKSNLNLDLLTTAPDTVYRYNDYLVQAIATNEASVSAPAVAVTVTVPAAASFVSATSTQGDCDENAGIVTCDFGAIGSGGFAIASVTFEATGNGGNTIVNTATVSNATPKLSNAAPTLIHACPAGYAEYDGTLAPDARYRTPLYQSAAGKQTVVFNAPLDYALEVGYQKNAQAKWKIRRFSRHAIYEYGPAGTYRWQITAGSDGGAYTLCILHP